MGIVRQSIKEKQFETKLTKLKFEALRAVTIDSAALWEVTPCKLQS
jgi:hypothetical protein